MVRSLDAGPERVVLVLARALHATLGNEGYEADSPYRKTYPALVVRERPAADIGKPDNATE